MNLQKINNVLVIAPHTDDETLGCGGTIKKLSKLGKNVYILVITNAHVGDSNLFTKESIVQVRKEALEAHKILRVKNTFFADFPAPRLDTYPTYKISRYISEKINELDIDTLFIPHRGDIHIDHRRTFEASIVASRPIGKYSVKRIYTYETLSETEWAAPYPEENFVPNIFVDISEELEYKTKAFSKFKSQIQEFPLPRSIKGIESLANNRGSIISVVAAECFGLVREII